MPFFQSWCQTDMRRGTSETTTPLSDLRQPCVSHQTGRSQYLTHLQRPPLGLCSPNRSAFFAVFFCPKSVSHRALSG